MTGSAIRELSAARDVPLVAAAFVESRVQLWDVHALALIGDFGARYSFGAKNLALHPAGEIVLTGISRLKGGILSAHRVPGGEELWRRTGLALPARVSFNSRGDEISCSLDRRSVARLDTRTGQTITVHHGMSRWFEGDAGQVLTQQKPGAYYLLKWGATTNDVKIDRLTFAPLAVSFGLATVCISEASGSVRCVDGLSGQQHWRYDPPEDSHVVRLHYSPEEDATYGVLFRYDGEVFRKLVRFDQTNGYPTDVCQLEDSSEEAFLPATHQLVTSAGRIIQLSTGKVDGILDFPQREYRKIE
jgi:hypothetical protein